MSSPPRGLVVKVGAPFQKRLRRLGDLMLTARKKAAQPIFISEQQMMATDNNVLLALSGVNGLADMRFGVYPDSAKAIGSCKQEAKELELLKGNWYVYFGGAEALQGITACAPKFDQFYNWESKIPKESPLATVTVPSHVLRNAIRATFPKGRGLGARAEGMPFMGLLEIPSGRTPRIWIKPREKPHGRAARVKATAGSVDGAVYVKANLAKLLWFISFFGNTDVSMRFYAPGFPLYITSPNGKRRGLFATAVPERGPNPYMDRE